MSNKHKPPPPQGPIKGIPIPQRMQRFQLWRGYPVHFTVLVREDGRPDFRCMDEHRRAECFAKNWCHLCGLRMWPPYYFIGGPRCVAAHRFVDGPMHVECAEYACLACPFLSSPNGIYRSGGEYPDGAVVYENVSDVRPDRMALVSSNVYTTLRNTGRIGQSSGPSAADPEASGQVVCVVGDYIRVDWDIMPAKEGTNETFSATDDPPDPTPAVDVPSDTNVIPTTE